VPLTTFGRALQASKQLAGQQGIPASEAPQQLLIAGVERPCKQGRHSSKLRPRCGPLDLDRRQWVGWTLLEKATKISNSKGSLPRLVLRLLGLLMLAWQRAPQPQHPVRPAAG